MKSKWTHLYFYIAGFCVGIVFSKIECNNKDNCLCIPGRPEYEFQCPSKFSTNGFVIHIEENKDVSIDCRDLEMFDMNLLPNVTLGNVDRFRIRYCPLPEKTFRSILNHFSITSINHLQFVSSPESIITLNKSYFEDMSFLQSLKLNGNGLIELQDTFDNMPNLIVIDLQENNITLKTNIFEKTPFLKQLDISRNDIETLPDNLFRYLRNLESLYLWGNKLRKLNKLTFDGLYNLRTLELTLNHIEHISEDSFKKLVNLTQLNLSKNKLSILPSNLFQNNTKLKLIKLRNNFNLKLPDYLFSNLTSLEEVDLSHCKLETVPEHIYENSINLKIIRMENTSLKYLPLIMFKELKNLRELYLQSNKINSIAHVLTPLKSLQKLYIQNNLIDTIDEDVFSNLIHLEEIYLQRNQITKIHYRAFYDTEKLKKINLSHNRIVESYGTNGYYFAFLENVVQVEEVNLSYNHVTQVENVINLTNKVNLLNLDLRHNQITSLMLRDLQAISKKLVVNLEWNNITTVDFHLVDQIGSDMMADPYHYSKNIPNTVLYLSNNPIKCDCQNFDLIRYFRNELPEVRIMFEIKSENLFCASPSFLQNLPLEMLPPSHIMCSLDTILNSYDGCAKECFCSWRPFDKSVVVDCTNGGLSSFPEIILSEINVPFNQTEIRLDYNNLSVGPDHNLTGYGNVTKLYISNNKIKSITWLPPKLQVLTLHNNSLNQLSNNVLNMLNTSYLVNLTLHNNPWVCSCNAKNLTDFLRQHRQVDARHIYCNNTTTSLISLSKKDLCSESSILYILLPVMSILLLSAVLSALYYRYQQELKIWLFGKNCCLWWVSEEDLDKDKMYDAFISYSHKDEDFVNENLVPMLEGKEGYKLCLHYRNWVPGEFITKQVTNSICESRRTIVILSSNFLESVWGKLEFRTAHTQAMTEGRTRVIIILYGDIDTNKLDNELKSYMKTNTYIKWGDPYFWNRLRYALPHLKKKVSNNQKHANLMNFIDDKFSLVPSVGGSSGTTPPVLSLDPNLLKHHPVPFISNGEMDTPPAEAGSLLTVTST